jgi:hypothetical protein
MPPSASSRWISAIVPISAYVLGCWTVFIWASNKGYQFTDEAFALISVSAPSSYGTASDFGYLLRPVYLLMNGDIAWFRIVGAVALWGCALSFGWNLSRFIDARRGFFPQRLCLMLAVGVCLFWQYPESWNLTPSYDVLNICGLLLIFAGLLSAVPAETFVEASRGVYRGTLGPSLLCAIGLVIMALTKPPSCAAAILLGLAWVCFLHPKWPIQYIATTAGLAIILASIAILTIDGSYPEFLHRKMQAFQEIQAQGNYNAHGIVKSIVGPFVSKWWKILQVSSFVGIILVLGLGWSWLSLSPRVGLRRWPVYALAVALGAILAWWRTSDLQGSESPIAFQDWRFSAWHFALYAMLAALAGVWLQRLRAPIDPGTRRIILAATILAVAPLAYSFGTANAVIFHMSQANIFCAAAMILLGTLAPPHRRSNLLQDIAFLCGAMSFGLLVGVILTPGRLAEPLWRQTESVALGPYNARLMVEPAIAEYIDALQSTARTHGFKTGTPVIDLSVRSSQGSAFLLGAKPLGSPWHLLYGPASGPAYAHFVLSRVPDAELRQAWVITDMGKNLDDARVLLQYLGLNFPAGYELVGGANRSDVGWTTRLWKPHQ